MGGSRVHGDRRLEEHHCCPRCCVPLLCSSCTCKEEDFPPLPEPEVEAFCRPDADHGSLFTTDQMYAYIRSERLRKALQSQSVTVPPGLDREALRKFILDFAKSL